MGAADERSNQDRPTASDSYDGASSRRKKANDAIAENLDTVATQLTEQVKARGSIRSGIDLKVKSGRGPPSIELVSRGRKAGQGRRGGTVGALDKECPPDGPDPGGFLI